MLRGLQTLQINAGAGRFILYILFHLSFTTMNGEILNFFMLTAKIAAKLTIATLVAMSTLSVSFPYMKGLNRTGSIPGGTLILLDVMSFEVCCFIKSSRFFTGCEPILANDYKLKYIHVRQATGCIGQANNLHP